MNGMIKTELWKSTHNRGFAISLLIGITLAVGNAVEAFLSIRGFDEIVRSMLSNNITNISYSPLGYSLFIRWMPISRTSLCSSIYFLIWPVLAAMPFGASLCREEKSGFIQQLLIRGGIFRYYCGKYLAVFISGGIAVCCPVAINLLLVALICPDVLPSAAVPINIISDGWFLSELYFSHPWIFAWIWIGVDFLFGGASATCCVMFGHFPAIVMLAPFCCFLLFDGWYSAMAEIFSWKVELSPLSLAMAASFRQNSEWAIGSVLLVLICISYMVGFLRLKKYEKN